jgi:hypothetical protein
LITTALYGEQKNLLTKKKGAVGRLPDGALLPLRS